MFEVKRAVFNIWEDYLYVLENSIGGATIVAVILYSFRTIANLMDD